MRWCQTILLLIAALYGSSAAAADGEFLQLNARARIHCNGAGVALTNGARTIEFQPNIGNRSSTIPAIIMNGCWNTTCRAAVFSGWR